MGFSDYIPLRVHTEYGEGVSGAEDYWERLSETGIKGIGIVDNNFYGAYDFYKHLKDRFKVIIGAEINKPFNGIVFFENEKGYRNFSRILSGLAFDKEGLIFIVFDIKDYEKLNFEGVPVYYGVQYPEQYYPSSLKIVAVPKVLYSRKEDVFLFSVMKAIREKRIYKSLICDEYLKEKEEMKRFPEDGLKGTFEIFERIGFSPFDKRKNFFSDDNANIELYNIIKGFNLKDEEKKRSEYEFMIIKEKNISGFFLLVKKIADFLKENEIMANVRGSAGGSFLLYLFGISKVNPLRFKIPFERFLNLGREDLPDVDIDVDYKRRDEVFSFIKKIAGKNRCGFVSVVNRFEYRSSFRFLSRIFGVPPSMINEDEGLKEDIQKISMRLIGKPSYISRHPSAIALSNDDVFERIPVKEEDGFYVLCGDKDTVEELGFIKLDILGVRGFSSMINVKYVDDINDENVFNAISDGKTIGAFQIESPPMRQILREIRPGTIEELGIALALIRPGASEGGAREIYLKARKGEAFLKYPDELKEILDETLGVFIYQEQSIDALKRFAGFTDEESERFRRILTKERCSDIKGLREIFFERARKLGRENIEDVWEKIEKFTRYGFNKAHSISYAYLSYLSMFSKIYDTIQFFRSVLNSGGGYYPVFGIVEESRRCGIDVILPDINESEWGFKEKDGKLLTGLGFVKFMSEKTYKKIIRERPFSDFYEFINKVRPDLKECDYLIKSGALDRFGIKREEMFSILYTGNKFKGGSSSDYFLQEMEALSFSSKHPLFNFERRMRIMDIKEGFVEVMGRVISERGLWTRRGERMCFLTIDDETGYVEVVVFPDLLKRISVSMGDIISVKGNYDKKRFSINSLSIENILRLSII